LTPTRALVNTPADFAAVWKRTLGGIDALGCDSELAFAFSRYESGTRGERLAPALVHVGLPEADDGNGGIVEHRFGGDRRFCAGLRGVK
jgi:hypothetical protein